MKKILILAFIGFLNMTVSAQAKIAFETTTLQFGTIEKGGDGTREFVFKNTGNAPLIITSVSSTCGCTIPEKPEKPIMPGETGIIKVKYNTNKSGPIRKSIRVIANVANSPITLQIRGEVK
jgi:hypothetical protein